MYFCAASVFILYFIIATPCRAEESNEHSYDVIILGAGVAGITAAKTLQEANITNYVLLEASERIGGRIHSVEFGGTAVDLGAQYMLVKSPVYDLAKKHNVIYKQPQSMFSLYATHSNGEDVNMFTAFNVIATERKMRKTDEMKNFNGSYWEFMWPRLKEKLKHYPEKQIESSHDLLRKIYALVYNGYSALDLGAESISQYPFPEDEWEFKNGFKTFLNILMGKKNEEDTGNGIPEKIITKKEAIKVEYGEGRVRVICSDGSNYFGKKIIVTLPLGVLKNLPSDFWFPPLPENKKKAIEGFAVSSTNKIFLKFNKRQWPDYRYSLLIGFNEEDKMKLKNESGHWPLDIAEISVLSQRLKLLQFTVIGKGARDIEHKTDNEIMKGCTDILKWIFPKKKRIDDPILMKRTYWNSNPFSKGSQAYRSKRTDAEGITAEDLTEPVSVNNKPILVFAGEATDPKYYGTVNGAFFSGIRAANTVI